MTPPDTGTTRMAVAELGAAPRTGGYPKYRPWTG